MGLLQRIADLVRSNLNDLLSKAEDPERMLNAAIEDMQTQLVEAKTRVAMTMADERRLAKELENENAKAADWEQKAMTAVRSGRDDLAMEALARKKRHDAVAIQFAAQLEAQSTAVAQLKKALTDLSAKLESTKRERSLLLARAKRAEAQRLVAESLGAFGPTAAQSRLERLEADVERKEAEAEAHLDVALLDGRPSGLALSEEIQRLEGGRIEDDLLALKAKMNAPRLGSGPTNVETDGDPPPIPRVDETG